MEHAGENASPEPRWAWKGESLQKCKERINVYLHYDMINDIKSELKFHSSAYNCNSVLHAVICCQINKSSAREDEIWFRIGGQSIRFSKYEYAAITGLRFGTSTFDPNVIHHPPIVNVYSHCIRDDTLLVCTLWDRFKEGCYREPVGDLCTKGGEGPFHIQHST
ncbi:hypothetical protein PTKIN_Ptkin10aG0135900 [Pterospermum kingtungense]